MKIAFVGAGNVAYHLAQALDKNGHQITDVYSRNITHAKALSQKLYDAKPTNQLDFRHSTADIFFISLPDDVLQVILNSITFPENITIMHTSGTVAMDIFENKSFSHYGVFYPLQTFSKFATLDIKKTPICIEASDENTEKLLEKIAFSICENVAFYDSNDRKILHLAAVFACNFTNHLYAISYDLLEQNGLSFELLKPLIEATTQKALSVSHPKIAQTGPANRKDFSTIQNHLELLKQHPTMTNLYKLLSENIIKIQ